MASRCTLNHQEFIDSILSEAQEFFHHSGGRMVHWMTSELAAELLSKPQLPVKSCVWVVQRLFAVKVCRVSLPRRLESV
jgi:hypothetical protein